MFTGIVETIGIVRQVIVHGTNKSFWIQSAISSSLTPDQSVSHDGVCLTVEEVDEDQHRVTAIEETLGKTNLGTWEVSMPVNLERCLLLSDRVDGHIVQGHIDCRGKCLSVNSKNGSWKMEIEFPKKFSALIVEKGSVCLHGISLTAFNVKKSSFTVAIIPFTYEHTNIQHIRKGDDLNIEFDLVGKYLLRSLSLTGKNKK